ncbi:MAG: hypothetical protein AAGA85_15900, partial [Bacteroidota bacterium]
MIKFVTTHPDYLFLMFLIFFVVIKVIIQIINSDDGRSSGDDSDGGILEPDPVLDLPPGVSLPIDRKTP